MPFFSLFCKAQTHSPWCSLTSPNSSFLWNHLGSPELQPLSLTSPCRKTPSALPRSRGCPSLCSQEFIPWPWGSRWEGRGAVPAPQESRKDTQSSGWASRIRGCSLDLSCSIPTGFWNNQHSLSNQHILRQPKSRSSCIPRTPENSLKPRN